MSQYFLQKYIKIFNNYLW